MSITAHEFLSILQVEHTIEGEKQDYNYVELLERVRKVIAERHSKELSEAIDNRDAAKTLKELILKYCVEHLVGTQFDPNALVEKIYLDMAGLGLLTEYLLDETVEEINLNGFDTVEIIYPNKTQFLHGEDAFPTATAALDIVKRMVRMGGMILDAQTPKVDSYIGNGTRISAMIPPAVPPERGVVVSIRKQSKSSISRNQLMDSGSVTDEMLDFLTMCLCNGISVGLAGGTGSGKTTDQAFLLNEYIRQNDDYNNRVYIIEDSRELNLVDYDRLHGRPARIIYTTTKPAPNPITMRDHIVNSLRYHPKLIVPAEVRDGAAYEAANAGQTGHTILTAFHADNAYDAYGRLVSMCHFANTGLSDERLLELVVNAWPVMVYKKQLKDNSRKYMEIFEATGVEHGKLQGQMIYQFVVEGNDRDGSGQITKVHGQHRKMHNISDGLYQKLKDNGVAEDDLRKLFGDAVKEGDI